MGFCEICDRPYPLAMLADCICAGCWREHAADMSEAMEGDACEWAQFQADRARGPLLLPEAWLLPLLPSVPL